MSPSPSGFFLHIKKLTRNVNEGHIREIFGNYGEVKAFSYPTHPVTGYPNGAATIEYASEESLIEALRCMDGGQIDGNFIICKRVASLEAPKNNQRREGNFKRSPPRYNRNPARRERSRSPIRRRSPEDRGRNYHRRSRSPVYRRSPIRRPISRSPIRRRSYTRSRSPVRRRSRSPVRRPISRHRSPPPRMSGGSRSPPRMPCGHRYRSRSPIPSFSRSPPRQNRFDSPSPVRGRYSNRSQSRTP